MVLALLAVVALAAVSYGIYKHYGLAAIKAELAKLEQEAADEFNKLKQEIVDRLKAKL